MVTQPSAVVRVGVFVDWQNCYRTARDAFGFYGSGIDGNINPLALARVIAATREAGATGELIQLRIYSGRASQARDAKTYAANRRQFGAWESSDPCVKVITRTLDYKLGAPREKGIDVQLAIDLVRTTLFDDEHDIAVLVSADTDLLPALELIAESRGATAIEVATWTGPHWSPQPLTVSGVSIRQHKLTEQLYGRIKDTRDYNLATPVAEAGKYPYGRRPRPKVEAERRGVDSGD